MSSMMKKSLIYFFLLIFIFAACKQESKSTFLIEGKITNLTNPELFVVMGHEQDSLTVDTIISKNGRFSFRGQADSLSAVTIYMENGKVWTTVWAQNGQKIILSGNAAYPELILAKGNDVNNLLSAFRTRNHDILKEKQDLADRRNALSAIDSISDVVNESQYVSKMLNLNHTLQEKVEAFVKENPTSLASLILIHDYILTQGEFEMALEHLGHITGDVTQTTYYKNLKKEINDMIIRIESATIGSPAPDFSVITMDKKDTLTLKSFENKYFLLSFSASWCEFCDKSNKDLVNVRKAIDKNKLGMLTIALDEDKTAWKSLAKREKMDWYQSVDTLGWRSQIAYIYNVNEIPASILIDKEGIIVGRDLPVDSLIRIFNP